MNREPQPIPIFVQANLLLRFIANQYSPGALIIDRELFGKSRESESLSAFIPTYQYLRILTDYLGEIGHIRFAENSRFAFSLTANGYHHIETIDTAPDSAQAFVAMWFDESMNEVYEVSIAPAIVAAGYNPLRIDQKDFFGKIDDEIIAEIRRSRFVVADFSHGAAGVRGSVYYESGFAHGLGTPVIYLCRDGSDLAFDTNHYPHIIWKTPEDLREPLRNRIIALIGEGPNVPASV